MLLVAFVVFIYHCALSSSYWHFLMIERVRLGNVPGRCSTSCFFQCSFEGLQFFVKNSVKGSTRYRASHGCFRACMTIEKRKLHSFQLASSQNATFFFFFFVLHTFQSKCTQQPLYTYYLYTKSKRICGRYSLWHKTRWQLKFSTALAFSLMPPLC